MPHIITFAHQKGGVGKSTLALNLALTLAVELSVFLLDTDPQGSLNSLANRFPSLKSLPNSTPIQELVKQPCDVLIVDTPPYLTHTLRDIFLASSLVVIPTRAGIFDLLAISKTVEFVKEAQAARPALRSGIALNMVKAGSTIASEAKEVLDGYGLPVLKSMISDRVIYSRSPLVGGVMESDDAKAKDEFSSFTQELIKILQL